MRSTSLPSHTERGSEPSRKPIQGPDECDHVGCWMSGVWRYACRKLNNRSLDCRPGRVLGQGQVVLGIHFEVRRALVKRRSSRASGLCAPRCRASPAPPAPARRLPARRPACAATGRAVGRSGPAAHGNAQRGLRAGSSRSRPGMNLAMPWRSLGSARSALRSGRKPMGRNGRTKNSTIRVHHLSGHQNGANTTSPAGWTASGGDQRQRGAHRVAHQQQRPMARRRQLAARRFDRGQPLRVPALGQRGDVRPEAGQQQEPRSSSPAGAAPRPARASRPGCRRSRAPAARPARRRLSRRKAACSARRRSRTRAAQPRAGALRRRAAGRR